MHVSSRQITRTVSDGTGLEPEQLALAAAAAVALAGALVILRAVDLVQRNLERYGARR